MNGLCKRNCSTCVFSHQCSGCSLCEVAVCDLHCNKCSSICPKRPGAFLYLQANGGAEIKLQQNKNYDLPVHIPILPDRMKSRPPFELLPVIAVHGGNMFSRNGERINASYGNHGFHKALNIDLRTKGILEFYVKDRTLEGFWDKRKTIYSEIKKMNFSGVIAPNFSVYEDTARMDHIYNMKRSSIVYNELMDEGIPAIPDISWYSRADLDRWCKEIVKSKVKTISFSFQVVDTALKASNLWKSYLLGFRYLCENIPSNINIIIAGLISKIKVAELYKAANGQTLHILNQSAFVQSRRATVSETREQNRDIPFDDLFIQNVNYFNRAYQEISDNYKNLKG